MYDNNYILINYISYDAEINLYTEKQVLLETCEELVIKNDLSFMLLDCFSLKNGMPSCVCVTVLCAMLHHLEAVF